MNGAPPWSGFSLLGPWFWLGVLIGVCRAAEEIAEDGEESLDEEE